MEKNILLTHIKKRLDFSKKKKLVCLNCKILHNKNVANSNKCQYKLNRNEKMMKNCEQTSFE